MGDLVDAYDEVVKRGVVYRASIRFVFVSAICLGVIKLLLTDSLRYSLSYPRCDDDVDTATERLEASGQAIIEKYLTSGGAKDLTRLLEGEEWGGVGTLRVGDVDGFDGFLVVLGKVFEKGVAKAGGSGS